MTDVRSLFGEQHNAYAQYRPHYPEALFEWIAEACDGHALALDIACGAGQASAPLRSRFDQVLACDSSPAWLTARSFPEQVGRFSCDAEHLPITDKCLDLIVVAQALHWFASERFFAEVRRTLRPNGLFCAWCYGLASVTPALDELTRHLHAEVLGDYWPAGRVSVDNGYRDIVMPLPGIATPQLEIRLEWSLEQLVGYLRTWSAVSAYEKHNGHNPLDPLQNELRRAWGDARQTRVICWPLHLIAGRNP